MAELEEPEEAQPQNSRPVCRHVASAVITRGCPSTSSQRKEDNAKSPALFIGVLQREQEGREHYNLHISIDMKCRAACD